MGRGDAAEGEKAAAILAVIKLSTTDHDKLRRAASKSSDWAWQLATATDPDKRDPQKAVKLAEMAVSLAPDVANYWNNLGVAQYRAGNWQAAIEALEKADGMLEEGDHAHRIFFAMAHWQLGHAESAHKLFGEGAAWISAHRSSNEMQLLFREEAEQLMELNAAGREELIATYYTQDFSLHPSAQELIDRGIWFRDRGQHDEAIKDFTQAVRLDPTSFQAFDRLALTQNGLGNHEQAADAAAQSIEINPQGAYPYEQRGWALIELKRLTARWSEAASEANRKFHWSGLTPRRPTCLR